MPISAFGTQGATPNISASNPNLSGLSGSIALNPSGGVTTPAASSAARALNMAAPSTPVKKQTTNNVDGSSTVTEYHAPDTTSGSSSTLPPAPTAPTTSATTSGMLPAYNPNGGVTDTVYTSGQPVTYQGGQAINSSTYPSSNQSQTNTQTQSQPQQSGTNTTYPGLISSLANNSIAGSPTAATAAQGLLNNANTNPLTSGASEQNYQQAVNDENTLKQQYAQFNAGIGSEAVPFAVRQGEQAQVQQQYLDQLDAAQQRVVQAQQGLNYGLTEQSQQQTGLNDAGNLGIAGQGQLQSGLTSAASAAQPQLGQPGQAYYNPQTGGAVGGSTGVPAGIDPSVWAQYQQDYATGNFGAIPASVSGNAQLYGQLQTSAPAGFNYNTAAGQAAGQQAEGAAAGQAAATNIETAGTAGTTGTGAALQSTEGTYNTMSAANTAAANQAQTVQQVLQSTGLNQGVPDYNQAINSLSGKLGSTKVAALTSAITELQSAYGNLLNSGGQTPTASEAQSLALLSPNSTAAQINTAISQLQTAAYNKLLGQYSQLQTEQSALQSGAGGSTGNTSYNSW